MTKMARKSSTCATDVVVCCRDWPLLEGERTVYLMGGGVIIAISLFRLAPLIRAAFWFLGTGYPEQSHGQRSVALSASQG
ncbi:hypothetical protein HX882_18010 [Pseudomonas gingeri]|uniref:Uncharacterized protein n=1 Tax=Pseudomonas gingeri TaxID=117681 RepID=A0A7Y7XFG2_9PSED|nr:hypothetical protein [Pseudomonas gingeri]NWB97798.1 hypothetical protein [Pseudomonas gingeri]